MQMFELKLVPIYYSDLFRSFKLVEADFKKVKVVEFPKLFSKSFQIRSKFVS